MIVGMKKVAVLCREADRRTALDNLGRVGVLHLIPVTPPAGEDIDRLKQELGEVQAAIQILFPLRPEKKDRAPEPGPATGADETVRAIRDASDRRKAAQDRLAALHAEEAALEPFGNFDPASLRALEAQGVSVSLHFAPGRKPVVPPDHVALVPIRETGAGQHFALVSAAPFDFASPALRIPERPLAAVRSAISEATADGAAAERRLRELTGRIPSLEAAADALRQRIRFREAFSGMGTSGPIAYLQGFCPADRVDDLRAAATREGWGLLVQDPSDADSVPTFIRSPAWVRPVKPIFDMLGILPGYREADVSAVFLVFFSVFFAMLIGDAGYGVFFLILTAVLRRVWRSRPPYVLPLLTILGSATVVWGVLTGSYLGLTGLPAPLRALKIDWLSKESHLTALCFLLGAIHLSVAHGWTALRLGRSMAAIGQAGWVGMTWVMYYMACYLVIGAEEYPLPSMLIPLFVVSLVAIIVFMTPWKDLRREFVGHIMLPLTVIGCFGDVVSYLRLYLVGSASVTLVTAFNELAVGSGIHSVGAAIGAGLILFIVHVLNILLGALAVMVHGIRLNALEFSSHLGIQWLGTAYTPFTGRDEERAGRDVVRAG